MTQIKECVVCKVMTESWAAHSYYDNYEKSVNTICICLSCGVAGWTLDTFGKVYRHATGEVLVKPPANFEHVKIDFNVPQVPAKCCDADDGDEIIGENINEIFPASGVVKLRSWREKGTVILRGQHIWVNQRSGTDGRTVTTLYTSASCPRGVHLKPVEPTTIEDGERELNVFYGIAAGPQLPPKKAPSRQSIIQCLGCNEWHDPKLSCATCANKLACQQCDQLRSKLTMLEEFHVPLNVFKATEDVWRHNCNILREPLLDAYRFLCRLNLSRHPIAEQHEYLEVVRALGKVLGNDR